MRESDFQPGFPGRLVNAMFYEAGRDGKGSAAKGLAFAPNKLPPKIDSATIGRLFDVLDRCRSQLVRLEGIINGVPGRTSLLAAMRAREAQASSQIEDTFASMKDIMLASVSPTRAPGEAMEVHRNRAAIEHGLRSPLPICNRLLREMHEALIIDPSMRPGKFRDVQVCIGDKSRGFERARFVPPPPDHVDACMRDWEWFVNGRDARLAESTPSLPYFVELALSHYQFETIHPFSDGNGRLGRALVTLAPVKDRELRQPVCNLSEWVHGHREEYYDGLVRVSTHGDWEGWVRFFCTALAEQAGADTRRAERLASLYDEYLRRFTTPRNSILLTKLLDHLFEFHGVTVQTAADALSISYTAAQRHVRAFEAAGVLTPVDDGKYSRVYFASEIVRAIQGGGEE